MFLSLNKRSGLSLAPVRALARHSSNGWRLITLTTAIYKAWFGFFSLEAAAQLSTLLVLLVLVILELEQRSRRNRAYTPSGRNHHQRRTDLTPARACLATAYCGAVFMLAFLLPALQLLDWSLEVWRQELNLAYLALLGRSTLLGFGAALLITSAALLLAYGARRNRDQFNRLLVRIATMGYGLPGTVLAVGIFIPVTALDQWLIGLAGTIGLQVSGLLQGSLLIMLLAYLVRFLAVAHNSVDSGMHRITSSLDESARLMGLSSRQVLTRVHLPLLHKGLLTAMTIVFVDVMKEMPITLMTRPFGWDTLAVKIFELTSEGEWERAALPSLSLIICGLLPILLFMRRDDQNLS